jgi:hypothetical protein
MPQLWVEKEGTWSLLPLGAAAHELSAGGVVPHADSPPPEDLAHRLLLIRGGDAAEAEWVLLAGNRCAVTVNGTPPGVGAHVLRDRDEIVLHGAGGSAALRTFFSTERLAVVEPLPAAAGTVKCARCKGTIEPGQMAVRCPSCECYHHEIAGVRNCWTYRPKCALCPHPTLLDGTYHWTPEELAS